jgi:hypothetical protein
MIRAFIMKTCTKCKESKPLNEFYTNKKIEDGKTIWCKECCKLQAKLTHKKDPMKKKFRGAKSLYGESMSQEKFTSMLTEQKNKCGICQCEMKVPYIDHDHDTKVIRMLLCHHCNTLLGMAKEKIDILESAVLYLKKFS